MYSRNYGGIESEGQLHKMQQMQQMKLMQEEEAEERRENVEMEKAEPDTAPVMKHEAPRRGLFGRGGLGGLLGNIKTDDLILIGVALLLLSDNNSDNDFLLIIIIMLFFC